MKKQVRDQSQKQVIHRWIRRGFLLWAAVSISWLANSVRTQGVDEKLLIAGGSVMVEENARWLSFQARGSAGKPALIFICGSGIHAHAYAPLLRPVADAGYTVYVVKLPYRFAPLASHRREAVQRVSQIMAAYPDVGHWVVAGHSLGGALTAQFALQYPDKAARYVLIGTTHPKRDDLSHLSAAFTKVYGSQDGVAPPARVKANAHLLPKHAEWVEIEGANHSQFGHYGHQLFDGDATISREMQQAATREALQSALQRQP